MTMPKTVTIDGKRYFPAEPMEQHLRDLRAALARCEIRCAEANKQNK
jgi:hypothetical protein